MKRPLQRILMVGLLLFATVGCDQATKQIARVSLGHHETRSFLGDVLRFEHAENPGAFLSFGAGLTDSARFWIFTGLVIAFLLWASYRLFKDPDMNWSQTVGWTLVVAGGFGNVIDRVAKGSVTDFIFVGYGPIHTGIFNVADMAIVAGVICLFFASSAKPAKGAH